MTGTFLNIATVLAGGFIGVTIGNRLCERIRGTVMISLGLMTLVVGCKMAITTQHVLIPLVSVLLGGIVGECLRLEDHLNAFGEFLERHFGAADVHADRGSISQGFVAASLIFCIGPLTFVGAFQQGLQGNWDLIAVNAALDFFVSIALAATLGVGVMFAAISVFVVQGTLTGLAVLLSSSIGEVTATDPWVIEFGATGGVLILGVTCKLLDIGKPRVANLLPAVLIAPLLVLIVDGLGFL